MGLYLTTKKKIKFIESVYNPINSDKVWAVDEEYNIIEETETYYIFQWMNGIKTGIGKELENKKYKIYGDE